MTPLDKHMRAKDIAVFKRVARQLGVYILVRRTNPESIRFIGVHGYSPKQLDCKFKTADRDWVHHTHGPVKVGGLVIDPTTPGAERAFDQPKKFQDAVRIWDRYAPTMVRRDGDPPMSSKHYHVQTDPAKPHFGAVKCGFWYNRMSATFVHGDYDLYDVVEAKDPTAHRVVIETTYEHHVEGGVRNVRSQWLMDVQNALNVGMGVPMVRHGAQAGFSDPTDEPIDCFHPDGATVDCIPDRAGIVRLYETTFGGRKHFDMSRPFSPDFGHWVRQ